MGRTTFVNYVDHVLEGGYSITRNCNSKLFMSEKRLILILNLIEFARFSFLGGPFFKMPTVLLYKLSNRQNTQINLLNSAGMILHGKYEVNNC